MRHPERALWLVGALGALGAGFALASCGGADGSSTGEPRATTETSITQTDTTEEEKPRVVRVTIRGGLPEGGIVRQSVERGDRVVLVVMSDVAEEVHLHGYDLRRDVPAGGTTRIGFRATIPGRFEVELEQRGVQIAELTVGS